MSWNLKYEKGKLTWNTKKKTRKELLEEAIKDAKGSSKSAFFMWLTLTAFGVCIAWSLSDMKSAFVSFSIGKQLGVIFCGLCLVIVWCFFWNKWETYSNHAELLSFLKKE